MTALEEIRQEILGAAATSLAVAVAVALLARGRAEAERARVAAVGVIVSCGAWYAALCLALRDEVFAAIFVGISAYLVAVAHATGARAIRAFWLAVAATAGMAAIVLRAPEVSGLVTLVVAFLLANLPPAAAVLVWRYPGSRRPRVPGPRSSRLAVGAGR